MPVCSAKAAEMVKVFENTFRAVNIALVNELCLLCDRMGLDVWEVLDAAFTKPFGIMPFYPGPGVGGHCIPLDPHYLEWKAREFNFNTRFIAPGRRDQPPDAGVRAREGPARYWASRAWPPRMPVSWPSGVAYKRDLDDWRESPAVRVIELLEQQGVTVTYHDPFIPSFEFGGSTRTSIDLTDAAIVGADMVVILTDHTTVDYEHVVDRANHVLDTRNATRGTLGPDQRRSPCSDRVPSGPARAARDRWPGRPHRRRAASARAPGAQLHRTASLRLSHRR